MNREIAKGKSEPGSFWIDLDLHHPDCDPNQITEALALEPWHAARVGQKIVGTKVRKTTVWMMKYRKGSGDDEFTQALRDCMNLLEVHREFLQSFVNEGGEILFTVNQRVDWDEGILFNLWLEPCFLEALGRNNAGLQVQAWSLETAD